jgi:hypothetical protein
LDLVEEEGGHLFSLFNLVNTCPKSYYLILPFNKRLQLGTKNEFVIDP